MQDMHLSCITEKPIHGDQEPRLPLNAGERTPSLFVASLQAYVQYPNFENT